jgi:hypothetical protein
MPFLIFVVILINIMAIRTKLSLRNIVLRNQNGGKTQHG